MGRRSGDFTHFKPTGPERDTTAHFHSQKIGLSTRHKDHQANRPVKTHGPSRAQLAREKAHSEYPFGKGVYWISILAFISVVLASLYWIIYFASS